jgi:hypothetical protein
MNTIAHMSAAQAFQVLVSKPFDYAYLTRPELPKLGRVEVIAATACREHGMEGLVMCEDVGNAALANEGGMCAASLPMPFDFAERLALGEQRERTHVERVMRAEWN